MTRTVVCWALALALAVAAGLAAEEKKAEAKKEDAGKPEKGKRDRGKRASVGGVVKKFDANTGSLTLTVKGKKGEAAMEKSFEIPKQVGVVIFEGNTQKALLKGREGFDQIKEGKRVEVILRGGSIQAVYIRTPPTN